MLPNGRREIKLLHVRKKINTPLSLKFISYRRVPTCTQVNLQQNQLKYFSIFIRNLTKE